MNNRVNQKHLAEVVNIFKCSQSAFLTFMYIREFCKENENNKNLLIGCMCLGFIVKTVLHTHLIEYVSIIFLFYLCVHEDN